MQRLYIGNKNYSSWSMRPWVLMKNAEISFEEVLIRFDSFDSGSAFRSAISKLSPVGKVPLLVDESLVVWDTLAIAEYLAEKYPEKSLWPQDRQARARARSICSEMHGGFSALRTREAGVVAPCACRRQRARRLCSRGGGARRRGCRFRSTP